MIPFSRSNLASRRSPLCVLAMTALMLGASCKRSLAQTTVYDSGGFESPVFIPDQNLDSLDPAPPLGSGPWAQDNGTSTAVVKAVNPVEGAKSILVTRNPGATGNTRWGVVKPTTLTLLQNVVTVYFDMKVVQRTLEYNPLFGVEAYDASGVTPKRIACLFQDASTGEIVYQQAATGTYVGSGVYLDLHVHHHYQLSMNFSDKVYSLIADGALVHTEGFVNPAATMFTDAPIATVGTSDPAETGQAYFDNYRIIRTTSRLDHLVWVGGVANNTWDNAITANWYDGIAAAAFAAGNAVVFDDTGLNTPVINLQGSLQPSSVRVAAAHSYEFGGSGALAGAGTLTKEGTGMLTLSSAHAYGGGTTLTGGTLRVTNPTGSATGTGVVVVGAAATLEGNGRINGQVSTLPGGVISPGVGVGALNLGSHLLMNGARLKFDLGSTSDTIAVAGDLKLNGGIDLTAAAGFGPGTYTLISYGGALTLESIEISSAPADFLYQLVTNVSGQVKVVVSPLPSIPSAPSALAGIAAKPNQNDLSWTDTSNEETTFFIERSLDNVVFKQIGTAPANATGYSDTSFREVATHYYRVCASNGAGASAYSNSISIAPPPGRDIVWKGAALNQQWDLLATANWIDPASQPTVFATPDRVRFDDTGSNAGGIGIIGALEPASVSVDSTLNYKIGGTGSIAGSTSLTKSGSGALTLSNTNTFTGNTVVSGGKLVLSSLANRWSFNGNLLDSAGGRTATLVEIGGKNATLLPTAVVMQGGGREESDYVDLGANLLPDVSQPFTIELWATQAQPQNWGRIFDFGDSPNENLFMSWTTGTNVQTDAVEWKDSTGTSTVLNSNQPYVPGVEFHIALVIEPGAGVGGSTRVTWYSAPAAAPTLGAARGTFDTVNTLAMFKDTHCWLGRSSYTPDATSSAVYDEFRTWRRALTSTDLEASHAAGADADLDQLNLTAGGSAQSLIPILPSNTAVSLDAAGAILENRTGLSHRIGSLAGVAGTEARITSGALNIGSNNTSTSFAGSVTGVGQLVKSGTGLLSLAGVNTCTGATTVTGGALFLNGNSPAATGMVTVATGAQVGGNGLIGGGIALQSGAIISPTGVFTSGSSMWDAGATYVWDIQDPDAGVGIGWDCVQVNGSLAINATPIVPVVLQVTSKAPSGMPGAIQNFSPFRSYSWKLVSTTAGITGFDAAKFQINQLGFAHRGLLALNLQNGGLDLVLTYTPSGFDAWAALKFSPEELASEATAVEQRDPDHDGVRNLLEYALGGDPKVSDASILPGCKIQDDRLVLTFKRLKDRTDIDYAVCAGPDPTTSIVVAQSLSGGPVTAVRGASVVTSATANPNAEAVEASDNVTISNARRRFMNLRIQRN